jgi:DNA-binding CsgD family transcriptional regulator
MTARALSGLRRRSSSLWLVGFGFWWTVYYSGATHGHLWIKLPQEGPFSQRAQLILLSVPFGLMLVALLAFRRRLAPLHERRVLLTGFAVLTGVSLALSAFGEMPFDGVAGGLTGTWLPQAAGAVMVVVWGELYGAAGARRACLGLCGSLLLGLGLSAVLRATADVAPMSAAVVLAFCPWLAVVTLFKAWKSVPLAPVDLAAAVKPFRMPPIVVLAMFTSWFTIGFMVSLTTPRAHLGTASWLGSALAVTGIALVMVWVTRAGRGFDFRKLFWPIVIYLAIAFMLLPIASYGFSRDVAVPGSALLTVLWITTSAYMCRRAQAPAIAVMGCNQLLNLAGVVLGGLACSALLSGAVLSAAQLTVVGIGAVSLLVLGSYPMLRRSGTDSVWGLRPDVGQAPSLSPEQIVAQRCAELAAARGLTPREQEVLVLMAQGMRADQIAERFTVSEATVRTHIKRLHEKLDVHSQPELMRMVVFQPAGE